MKLSKFDLFVCGLCVGAVICVLAAVIVLAFTEPVETKGVIIIFTDPDDGDTVSIDLSAKQTGELYTKLKEAK